MSLAHVTQLMAVQDKFREEFAQELSEVAKKGEVLDISCEVKVRGTHFL